MGSVNTAAIKPFWGACYSPFTREGQVPENSSSVTESQVRADLGKVQTLTDRIRTFGSNGAAALVPRLAGERGISCLITAWIGSLSGSPEDTLSVSDLIAIANDPLNKTSGLIVGSGVIDSRIEELEFNQDIAAPFFAFLDQADAASALPVGTECHWSVWGKENTIKKKLPQLIANGRVLYVSIDPFHDFPDSTPKQAARKTMDKWKMLIRLYPDNEVVISNIANWPSDGTSDRNIPGRHSQRLFVEEFKRLAEQYLPGRSYYINEVLDEPWKKRVLNSSEYNGLFYSDGRPKPAVNPLLGLPDRGYMGLNFGIFTKDGQSPSGTQPSESQIDQDLASLQGLTQHIRTFGVIGMSGAVPRLAAARNLYTMASAYIGSLDRTPENTASVNQLLALAATAGNKIDKIIVGSDLLSGHPEIQTDPTRAAGYIGYVVNANLSTNLPVGIEDNAAFFLNDWVRPGLPGIFDNIDFIGIKIDPFKDRQNTNPYAAARYAMDTWIDVTKKYPDKKVVITSLGSWPTDGSESGNTAGGPQQAAFITRFMRLAKEEMPDGEYYLNEAVDEPWKTVYGINEASRGLIAKDGALKESARRILGTEPPESIGVCYGIFTQPGQSPSGAQPTEGQIKNELNILSGVFTDIRTFGITGISHEVPSFASEKGFGVLPTAWMEYLDNNQENTDAVNAAVSMMNNASLNLSGFLIGSGLLSKKSDLQYSPELAAPYIQYLKQAGSSSTVPIGIEDNASIFTQRWPRTVLPELFKSIDFIGIKIDPFLEFPIYDDFLLSDPEGAAEYAIQKWRQVMQVNPDIPVVVTSLSLWSTGDFSRYNYPTPEYQKRFVTEFRRLARQAFPYDKYYFDEAFDEPWKFNIANYNAKRGLFNSNGTPKPALDAITAIDAQGRQNPSTFVLAQNYPNPFSGPTTVKFSATRTVNDLDISVYDTLGRKVKQLYSGRCVEGSYFAQWDGSGHAPGMYFLRITANGVTDTKKMMLVR